MLTATPWHRAHDPTSFPAPGRRRPPWHLYRFTFHTAFGVATAEPYGATRWRFAR